MKLNLHPKGIPKLEPLGTDTPLKKGGVVVGMRKEGDKEKIYFVGDDCHLLCRRDTFRKVKMSGP